MAKLTKAQAAMAKKLERTRQSIYLRRKLGHDKEECFIGRKKVHAGVFMFFFSMGYLALTDRVETKKYDYCYLRVVKYKLDEYLADFQMPYVVPE